MYCAPYYIIETLSWFHLSHRKTSHIPAFCIMKEIIQRKTAMCVVAYCVFQKFLLTSLQPPTPFSSQLFETIYFYGLTVQYSSVVQFFAIITYPFSIGWRTCQEWKFLGFFDIFSTELWRCAMYPMWSMYSTYLTSQFYFLSVLRDVKIVEQIQSMGKEAEKNMYSGVCNYWLYLNSILTSHLTITIFKKTLFF